MFAVSQSFFTFRRLLFVIDAFPFVVFMSSSCCSILLLPFPVFLYRIYFVVFLFHAPSSISDCRNAFISTCCSITLSISYFPYCADIVLLFYPPPSISDFPYCVHIGLLSITPLPSHSTMFYGRLLIFMILSWLLSFHKSEPDHSGVIKLKKSRVSHISNNRSEVFSLQ